MTSLRRFLDRFQQASGRCSTKGTIVTLLPFCYKYTLVVWTGISDGDFRRGCVVWSWEDRGRNENPRSCAISGLLAPRSEEATCLRFRSCEINSIVDWHRCNGWQLHTTSMSSLQQSSPLYHRRHTSFIYCKQFFNIIKSKWKDELDGKVERWLS